MGEIKRINLCFSMNRKEDKEAYEKIINNRNKTEFIVNSVLQKNNPEVITEDKIKQIFKQVISEIIFSEKVIVKNETRIDEIPDDIFDMFSRL